MISKEEVQHITKLARIDLDRKEVEKFQKELSSILDYISKLKELDISEAKASFYSVPETDLKKGPRNDEPGREESIVGLIKSVPAQKDNYIKVKSVF